MGYMLALQYPRHSYFKYVVTYKIWLLNNIHHMHSTNVLCFRITKVIYTSAKPLYVYLSFCFPSLGTHQSYSELKEQMS